MSTCVPQEWLSAEHGQLTGHGVAAAHELMAAAFPPHPEDIFGTLAANQLALTTNTRVRAELSATNPGIARVWWLQGLVLGFCENAAASLNRAADLAASDAHADLRGLANHVLERTESTKRAAAAVVFELLEAVLTGDRVGCAWALQNLFTAQGTGDDVDAQTEWVKRICAAALLSACASAQLQLGAEHTH